jgi:YidC/Oxa1 family membrane protein insertase
MWSAAMETMERWLETLALNMGGELGYAIIAMTFMMRLFLLPLGMWVENRTRNRAAIMARLQPEIDEIQAQHAGDPRALLTAMRDLRETHGLSAFDSVLLVNMAIQLPLFTLAFQAIRGAVGSAGGFLWAPSLARPDIGFALVAASFVGLSAQVNATSPGQRLAAVAIAVVVFAVTSRFVAGIALYSATSAGAGLLQSLLRRRVAQYLPA